MRVKFTKLRYFQTKPNFSPASAAAKYQSDRPFKTLLNIYSQDWHNIGLSMLFYTIKHSPVWIQPLVIANIIDIISSPSEYPVTSVWINVLILAVAVVQNIPTHYLHIRYISLATRTMELNLRSAITRRLQELSIGFYQQNPIGALQIKLVRDVEAINMLTNHVFQLLPSVILTIIIAVVVTAMRAPWFLLFFLATVPSAAMIIRFFRGPIRKRNAEFRREMEGVSAHIVEMLKMIPVTRAHGAEIQEIERTDNKLMGVHESALRLDEINAFTRASAWVTLRICSCVCLLMSALFVYHQTLDLSVGDVVLLTGYFTSLTQSVVRILTVLPQIGKGFEALRSIGEVLESPDIEYNRGKFPIGKVKGKFSFQSVSFTYGEGRDLALQDFSLEVAPGENIAIVGASGAGKSTLLSLIIGFLRPTQGKIYLDGQDLNSLDLRTYRQFIAVVPQETILFSGTVRENILYGCPEAGEDALKKAILEANAEEFVSNLPQGLQTMVGENGTKLSGGQRQRLAIARALVRNPQVLILDEATSSLDTVSESLIQSALDNLMKHRTTFIVAHRLSTIRKADRIVVLEAGRIVEIGNQEELLANQGKFSELHNLQT